MIRLQQHKMVIMKSHPYIFVLTKTKGVYYYNYYIYDRGVNMLLVILVVIAVLFLMYRKYVPNNSTTSTEYSENTHFKTSNNSSKINVTSHPQKAQTIDTKNKHNADNDYANVVFLYLHKGKWKEPRALEYTSSLAHKTYQFSVNDPLKKHADMLKQGFFCEATPEEILITFRKAKLEDILKQHGIAASGKKDDLVKAIIGSIPIQKLELPVMYFISDKGIQYIEQHKDLILLYKKPLSNNIRRIPDSKKGCTCLQQL